MSIYVRVDLNIQWLEGGVHQWGHYAFFLELFKHDYHST
jgi:hypothetical protein